MNEIVKCIVVIQCEGDWIIIRLVHDDECPAAFSCEFHLNVRPEKRIIKKKNNQKHERKHAKTWRDDLCESKWILTAVLTGLLFPLLPDTEPFSGRIFVNRFFLHPPLHFFTASRSLFAAGRAMPIFSRSSAVTKSKCWIRVIWRSSLMRGANCSSWTSRQTSTSQSVDSVIVEGRKQKYDRPNSTAFLSADRTEPAERKGKIHVYVWRVSLREILSYIEVEWTELSWEGNASSLRQKRITTIFFFEYSLKPTMYLWFAVNAKRV